MIGWTDRWPLLSSVVRWMIDGFIVSTKGTLIDVQSSLEEVDSEFLSNYVRVMFVIGILDFAIFFAGFYRCFVIIMAYRSRAQRIKEAKSLKTNLLSQDDYFPDANQKIDFKPKIIFFFVLTSAMLCLCSNIQCI